MRSSSSMSHATPAQCSTSTAPRYPGAVVPARKCAERHALAVVLSHRVKATRGQGPRRCPEGSDSACAHSGRRQPCARRGADYAPFFVHHQDAFTWRLFRGWAGQSSHANSLTFPPMLCEVSATRQHSSRIRGHPAPAAARGVPQGNVKKGWTCGCPCKLFGRIPEMSLTWGIRYLLSSESEKSTSNEQRSVLLDTDLVCDTQVDQEFCRKF